MLLDSHPSWLKLTEWRALQNETTLLKIAVTMWNFFLFLSCPGFLHVQFTEKHSQTSKQKLSKKQKSFERGQLSCWMQRTISYGLASLAQPFRSSVDNSDFHWYWQIYGAIIKKEQSGLDQCFQWMRYILAFHQYQTCITTFPACSIFLRKDINCGQGKARSFLEAPCYSFSMEQTEIHTIFSVLHVTLFC